MDNYKLLKYEELMKSRIKDILSRSNDLDVDSNGDELDIIQSNVILDMAYEYNARNNNTLNLLHEALSKIKAEEYGICEECGDDINEKRLNIFPEVKLCIRCAEVLEREKIKR